MTMNSTPTNKYNKSIDEMNLMELNNAIDTPKTGMNLNFSRTVNSSMSNSQNISMKNKFKMPDVVKIPENTKLNSGRNSILDKKYNFSKNTIEDKLNKLNTVSSNRNSYSRIGSHKRITMPIERGITDNNPAHVNLTSKQEIENEINKNHDLISFLDDDLDPFTQIKEFSSLINKANRYNLNDNRKSNVNIRPIHKKNNKSKKMLNNSIMFEKFEESKNDDSKMEESMLFMDFEN